MTKIWWKIVTKHRTEPKYIGRFNFIRGWHYLYDYAFPSFFDALGNSDHTQHFAEQDANSRAFTYFNNHVENYSGWDPNNTINGYNWNRPFNDIINQLSLSNNLTNPKWYRFEF